MKKKGLLILAAVLVFAPAAFADQAVSPDKLPQRAKDLIAQYFPGKTVQFAEADFSEYEVVLNDGSELNFSGSGDWKEIKSFTGVPAGLLPAGVTEYVNQNFPDVLILTVEKDWASIEVQLANRMELYFDNNGKFLGQKFDD